MKKILLVLISTISVFSLLLLLAAFPRFTDDKDLVFVPVDVPIEKEVHKELMNRLKNKSVPVILDERLLTEMEELENDIDFFHLTLIVGIIKRLKYREIELPQKYEDFSYYESLVKKSLEREVYRLNKIIVTQDDLSKMLYMPSIPETFEDRLSNAFFGVSEIFTFQKNRTLNDLWKAVQKFDFKADDMINLPYDPKEFGYSNFFGQYILSCSIPATSILRKEISTITSNKASEGISRSSHLRSPSYGGCTASRNPSS